VTYKPLPPNVTIAPSGIEGLGLFASRWIEKGCELGITHVADEGFVNGYIRTPLGGFFNHSEKPNCEAYVDGRYVRLRTLQDIQAGEELTAFYWLYTLSHRG